MAVSAAILPARMCGNSDRKGAKSHAVRRVRQTSKSGLAGGWGGPNERI